MMLCDILIKYIMKYGRTQPIRWQDLQEPFEKEDNTKLNNYKALKNKYDAMRKDYNLWKSLKHGETGLGWIESTKQLNCSDEWWDKKTKDCIRCIDGTHIMACIPETQQLRYIGRKGIPTFNVMATCDFDMCFTFASLGWEGSAHDTRVFLHAINTPAMNFPKPPEGKYYLVDKGYPDRNGYTVPYSKTRYHQSQFAHEPPNNMQENFNRSHSSLRSYIEMSFGILKGQWKILNRMPKFNVQTQIDVITATFALHNYIRGNSEEATLFDFVEQHPNCVPHDGLCDVRGSDTSNEDFYGGSNNMKQIRNDIVALIWNDRRR
ncbi:hypothetical protein LXL04_035563 [Taraxacum kok-saghyz]